mgnify:CR=1 FL=1
MQYLVKRQPLHRVCNRIFQTYHEISHTFDASSEQVCIYNGNNSTAKHVTLTIDTYMIDTCLSVITKISFLEWISTFYSL